ncbi:hypothetical protein LJC48_02245 [Desulfovibrio sp. OttesenSCG-928-C06]|nr:hypothetical protein [Desulfovibrio sp. OttesenSCG-928-C06]
MSPLSDLSSDSGSVTDNKTQPEVIMLNIDSELTRIQTREPVLSGGSCLAGYAPDAGFIGFAGHFPDYPVLPAFIQVQMAVHALCRAQGKKLALAGIGTAKFTSQARPGDSLQLECSPAPQSSRGGLAGMASQGEQAGVGGTSGSANMKQGWDCVISNVSEHAGPDADAGQVAKFRIYLAEV